MGSPPSVCRGVKLFWLLQMSEDIQGENKDNGTPVSSSPTDAKPQEADELEVRKAALEAEVSGLEGTIESLKEDILRKRQERRDDGEQPIDEEALLARLEANLETKVQDQLKPVLEENEKLRKAVLKSNEEALRAKRAALDSLNARIASSTVARSSAVDNQPAPEAVELPADELKIAQELGLKNPRYMKEVEVL